MNVSWIEYKGKKILFSDYEGCKTSEEMISILHQEADILKNQIGKTLVMANYEKSFGSVEYMKEIKEIGNEVLKEKIEKTATLGITGVKEAFFKSYVFFTKQKSIRLFPDKISAMEWLISEE